MDDLLARAALHRLGLRMAQIQGQRQEPQRLFHRSRRAGLHESAQFSGNVVHRSGIHAHGHALPGTERVDGHWERGNNTPDRRFLEEQRLATARFLHLTVGDLRDLQLRGDGMRNTDQLTRFFEQLHPVPERFKRHAGPTVRPGDNPATLGSSESSAQARSEGTGLAPVTSASVRLASRPSWGTCRRV